MPDIFSGGGFSFAQLMALVQAGIIARLGGDQLAANGKTGQIISWPGQFDQIIVVGGVPNYAGADAISFRFGTVPGGPVDSGANYWWRSIFCAAGGAALTDNPNASATLVQMGEKTAQARVFQMHVFNWNGRNKIMKAMAQIGSAAAATVPDSCVAISGQWFNTAPIQCIQMLTLTNNMGAGAQYSVFGLNSNF